MSPVPHTNSARPRGAGASGSAFTCGPVRRRLTSFFLGAGSSLTSSERARLPLPLAAFLGSGAFFSSFSAAAALALLAGFALASLLLPLDAVLALDAGFSSFSALVLLFEAVLDLLPVLDAGFAALLFVELALDAGREAAVSFSSRTTLAQLTGTRHGSDVGRRGWNDRPFCDVRECGS